MIFTSGQIAMDPHTGELELRYTTHLLVEDLPPQEKQLVISTEGIVALGAQLAAAYLASQ